VSKKQSLTSIIYNPPPRSQCICAPLWFADGSMHPVMSSRLHYF